MIQSNTVKKVYKGHSVRQRYTLKQSINKDSWRLLSQKIIAMIKSHASPKELSVVIARNRDFAEYIVEKAFAASQVANPELQKKSEIDHATIIWAILILGFERLCELLMVLA